MAFRSSIAPPTDTSIYARATPRDAARKTRGQNGFAALLFRRALSVYPGALRIRRNTDLTPPDRLTYIESVTYHVFAQARCQRNAGLGFVLGLLRQVNQHDIRIVPQPVEHDLLPVGHNVECAHAGGVRQMRERARFLVGKIEEPEIL
jgi:hypothetical protein